MNTPHISRVPVLVLINRNQIDPPDSAEQVRSIQILEIVVFLLSRRLLPQQNRESRYVYGTSRRKKLNQFLRVGISIRTISAQQWNLISAFPYLSILLSTQKNGRNGDGDSKNVE
jgi:hypothetical protein